MSILSPLPDVSGLIVGLDTEGSGLFPDDGARISVVSWAFEHPDTGQLVGYAAAFDQGQATDGHPLPLGPKDLGSHQKRIDRLVRDHPYPGEQILWAPNRQVDAWGRLVRWLSRQRLVIHNAKYDALMFDAGLRGCEDLPPELGGGIDLEPAIIACTQVAQAVIDPSKGTALKPTSVRLNIGSAIGLDEGTEDAEQRALQPWKGPKKDPRFDLIPWSVIKPYAILDAKLHYLLHDYQMDVLSGVEAEMLGLPKHVRRETALMRVLYQMERRGVGYDVEGSREQVRIIDKLVAEVVDQLPFKPTYPAAKKYFFGDEQDADGNPTGNLGLLPYSDKITKPSKTFPDGQPQVDDEVVSRLVRDGAPNAALFQRWAELASARGKWYQAWADLTGKDGRLRTCHRQTTVVSGRLSVERAQLHAIPRKTQIPDGLRDVRQLIIPKPGHRLMEIDVSQAEPRIAVAIGRCRPLLERFQAGEDSHGATTKLVFGLTKDDPQWDEMRQIAKRLGLAILYGVGVNTMQQQLRMFTGRDYPIRQIKGWIDDWKKTFPELVQAYKRSELLAIRDGFVRLVNGKISYMSPYEPTYKALNREIQGAQAEALKDSMVEVERKYPGMLILSVHDSLVIEPPEELADERAQQVRQILIRNFEEMFERPWERGGTPVRVPFDADVKQFGK